MKLSDVKSTIEEIRSSYEYLDAIFVNAGIGYASKRVLSEDDMMAHFQVNYLAQFMLVLHMLELLEKSDRGGRVIFNATRTGSIHWDDLQLERKWSYEEGIHQSMVAKRMFLSKLSKLYEDKALKVSFIGFEISKIVWTNQVNIIPFYMKVLSRMMKLFGSFIDLDTCGNILVPLFTEDKDKSFSRSGSFITWKNNQFERLEEEAFVLDAVNQERLWQISLDYCKNEKTRAISDLLQIYDKRNIILMFFVAIM